MGRYLQSLIFSIITVVYLSEAEKVVNEQQLRALLSTSFIPPEPQEIALAAEKGDFESWLQTNRVNTADIDGYRDSLGNTALMWTCSSSNSKQAVNAANKLMNLGASVDARNKRDSTPTMKAAQNNFADMIRNLAARGANIDATNKDGDTALMIAARQNKLEAVQMLVAFSANTQAKNNEKTALQMVLEGGNDNPRTKRIILILESREGV